MNSAVLVYLETTYTKIRLLRQTEKSTIWLATDRAGQLAVLKRLALTGLPLKELQEANCPLCPQIYYYAEDEGETIIVEEHIAGKPLDQLTADQKLTEKEAADLLLALSQGLTLLHSRGILHRDIKPSNLLKEKSGQIRLIDFDAARLIKDEADEDTTLLGTRGYAPPEQYGYGQTDARSDLYALGMTIKRLLPADYSGFLTPIIRKCAAVDPKERYQSAPELAQALKRHLFFHKIKRPLLAALTLALLLFFALSSSRQIPVQQESAAETPATTESQPPAAPASDAKEAEQPPQDATVPLSAAPEKAPAIAPAEVLPPPQQKPPASPSPPKGPQRYLLPQLLPAPFGADPCIGSQKNLDLCMGEDDGPYIPSVHDHIVLPRKAFLNIKQRLAYFGKGTDPGSHGRDLLCPEKGSDILSLEPDDLLPVFIPDTDLCLTATAPDGLYIGRICSQSAEIQSHGAVHCPGIHIDVGQLSGELPGDGAFSGPCRAVYRYINTHSFFLIQFLYS